MTKESRSKNDLAWEALFQKYNILSHIESSGHFIISAKQIKEFREPRLMAKFDHKINLPQLFKANELAILPISRGDYMIAHLEAYHPFEALDKVITKATLPDHLQSLSSYHIPSETIAINCALASGILADFLEEGSLIPTVSGRMGSGHFCFDIQRKYNKSPISVAVHNAQIEIDAAFEGIHSLSILEAKRDLAEDFLIRQLYYPYRVWNAYVTKTVKPVFLVYSNGIFHLYEYQFQTPYSYNSLTLVKQKNYSIEDTAIHLSEIQALASNTKPIPEPAIAFPQANSFERIINLCELLYSDELTHEQVTEEYAFNTRQTNYYTDAARYLGLLEKSYMEEHGPTYSLTPQGKKTLELNYKQRQLAFCELILRHQAFRKAFDHCMETGTMPSAPEIISIMKGTDLYNIKSDSTYTRRSSTIISWISWILRLTEA